MLSKRILSLRASEKYRKLQDAKDLTIDEQLFMYLMGECAGYHKKVESLVRRLSSQKEDESLDEVFETLEDYQGLIFDLVTALRLLGYKGPINGREAIIWASQAAQEQPGA